MTAPLAEIRLAAAQYPLDRFETLQAYQDKAARWVAEAAGHGAQLLAFPEYGAMELAALAADAGDLTASLATVSDAQPHMLATYSDLARQHGLHILTPSGPCRRPDGRYVNRACLVSPSGRVGAQDKRIMTPFESNWGIIGGTELMVFDTALGAIAIAICYDSEFPLLVRAQCEAGAEIVLIPSCTEFVSGYNRVRIAAQARALENGCVTVHSPTVGLAPWSPAVDRNAGCAGIFVPSEHGISDTGVLAAGTLDEPGWVYATADLARLRQLPETGEMRNVRDWPLQPGAMPLASHVTRCDLR